MKTRRLRNRWSLCSKLEGVRWLNCLDRAMIPATTMTDRTMNANATKRRRKRRRRSLKRIKTNMWMMRREGAVRFVGKSLQVSQPCGLFLVEIFCKEIYFCQLGRKEEEERTRTEWIRSSSYYICHWCACWTLHVVQNYKYIIRGEWKWSTRIICT